MSEALIRRGSMNAEQAERRRKQVGEELALAYKDACDRAGRELAWLDERIPWLREHGGTVDDYERDDDVVVA